MSEATPGTPASEPAVTPPGIDHPLLRDALPELEAVGLWRCCPRGRILDARGPLFQRPPLAAAGLLGAALWALPATRMGAPAARALRFAVERGEGFSNIELGVADGLGQRRRLLMGGAPVSAGPAAPAGYQGWIREVSGGRGEHRAQGGLDPVRPGPDSAFAIFDADSRLQSHTPQWLALQGRAVREALTLGMRFEDLLTREMATYPFRAFDPRKQKAWRAKRLACFQAADGEALEFGAGRGRWRAIRCLSLADGGTLMLVTGVSATAAPAEAAPQPASDAERFRSYLASSGEWFWEVDADLRLTHISERLMNDFRLGPSKALGRQLPELMGRWAVDEKELTRFSRALGARQPFDGIELLLKDPTARRRYVSVSGVPFTDASGGFAGLRGIGRDVTQTRRMQRRLTHRSTHDELTGLRNRLGLQKSLDRLLARADRQAPGHALCYLDVDQFQVINDTCGYAAGDALLQRIAAVLVAEVDASRMVARIGGDEFAILLPRCERERALATATRIGASIREQIFTWEDQPFHVTSSIGVAHSTSVPASATELLRAADSACYAAKDSGRDRAKLFSADDSTLNLRHGRMHWIARINSALQENRLELYAQPIAKAVAGGAAYLHYEVLLRLHLRDGRTVRPNEFLPAAEQYNLITNIDRWVVEHCIAFLDEHPVFLGHLSTVSVNLSGRSMGDQDFQHWCTDMIGAHPEMAAKLCFEVTETAMMGKLAQGQHFIKSMRNLGCSFALDDFGTGLSSFAYLKDLDVDYLKIDGQFVKDLDNDPVHRAMVRSINEVAHLMGKKTIAEFVENDAVRSRLSEIGVDLVQGYGIGKPIPIIQVI